jgi:MerR family transcriptional regulator, copper efflux regulator
MLPMAPGETHQIGEVAEAVGLSIRTIRHYDEMGVVEPSGRTTGGFRLYTDADVERLGLVKRLKPLQFSLEEIHELLDLLDPRAETIGDDHTQARLEWFVETGDARCEALRAQLSAAEDVMVKLRAALDEQQAAPRRVGHQEKQSPA